jgi:hypothetical protein
MSEYEVCQVPNYKVKYELTKKTIKPIQTLKVMLTNNDLQLHERFSKDELLKLSIDVDKMTLHNPTATFDKTIGDICEYIDVTPDDISYTTNFSLPSGSHHVVMPKYHMKSAAQKELWADFKTKYHYGDEIDAGIFGKNGWFRLPNQTKESVKGTEHIIQKGNMEDFILKYIPSDCVEYVPKRVEHFKASPIMSVAVEPIVQPIEISPETIHPPVLVQPISDENDKYLTLLFDVIKNERDSKGKEILSRDPWFQICGA